MNQPWKIAAAYHERTKHHLHRSARSLGYLDWATQPDPFRRFDGAPLVPLRFRRDDARPAFDDLFMPGAVEAKPVTVESISSLLELSLGLSAWKEFQGSRWALRINPSSGNLHPTEGYLVVGPLPGLSDHAGVYHYAPKEHALERRAEFDASQWNTMADRFPHGSFLVALTSIHWREAWKYGERAYRYCQHDVGHALAAVAISAAVLGWRAVMIHGAGDDAIASLLGLDRKSDFADAEQEQQDLLLAIMANPLDALEAPNFRATNLSTEAIRAIVGGANWFGKANPLSADHVDWEIIDDVATACVKPDGTLRAWSGSDTTAPTPLGPPLVRGEAVRSRSLAAQFIAEVGEGAARCTLRSEEHGGAAPGHAGQPNRPALGAAVIIRQRRSAVAFDGKTSITAEQFYWMMDRLMPRFDVPPWSALGRPVCVHLGLFVHLVERISPGLYCLVRAPENESELRAAMAAEFLWERPAGCPDALPLFLLQRGDARRVAAQVSCGQEIAGESAFSLGMIAEFERPMREYGAWFYRRLFWECGVIGQVLYLEAEAAGVRGTGIGCFVDDPVHEVFGLRGRAYQSLYHFTIGGAVEDTRLTTRAPYPPEVVANRASGLIDFARQ